MGRSHANFKAIFRKSEDRFEGEILSLWRSVGQASAQQMLSKIHEQPNGLLHFQALKALYHGWQASKMSAMELRVMTMINVLTPPRCQSWAGRE